MQAPGHPGVKQATTAYVDVAVSAVPAATTTDTGLTNRLLMEDFTRRRGGRKRITTGAVALQFDHGLAKIQQCHPPPAGSLQPPYSLALCSGQRAAAENTGVDAAKVDGWVRGGLCEIWNHSRNHAGAVDEVGAIAEIVTGPEELSAQIPSVQIDGFAVPGTANRGFTEGFIAGTTPAEFATTGGQIILQHHAVSSGYILGTQHRILYGEIRQGLLNATLDKATLDSAKADIGKVKS